MHLFVLFNNFSNDSFERRAKNIKATYFLSIIKPIIGATIIPTKIIETIETTTVIVVSSFNFAA